MKFKAMEEIPKAIKKLREEIEKEKGVEILAVYQEPYSQLWQILVSIEIEKIQPTPFQREISLHHLERLAEVISKTKRYIDPIVLVRPGEGIWLAPDGNHRKEAMEKLGKEKIIGILIPEPDFAFKILSLNVGKPHDLREKSLEAIKIYQELMEKEFERPERDLSPIFDEPSFLTLGILYQQKEKFSGGAYYPFLKKFEKFLEKPLKEAIRERERRGELLFNLDLKVIMLVEELRKGGIQNPFLKAILVSRANPFSKRKVVEIEFDEAIKRFEENLEKINFKNIYENFISEQKGII